MLIVDQRPKNLHRLALPYIKTLSLFETRIPSSSSGAIPPGPSNYEIPCVERWESTRMRWRDPSERGALTMYVSANTTTV